MSIDGESHDPGNSRGNPIQANDVNFHCTAPFVMLTASDERSGKELQKWGMFSASSVRSWNNKHTTFV